MEFSKKVSLIFCGDIYINSGERNSFIKESLKELLKSHDIRSCNFEAPIYSIDSNKINKVGSYLNHTVENAQLIKNEKFNVINLANNHIYDFGNAALENTLNFFSSETTLGAGLTFNSAYQLKIIIKNGIKCGFLSFCEAEFGALTESNAKRGGYAWVNYGLVDNLIKTSKMQVDFLFVQVHAGIEEIELPLPEWRERYRRLIECGADAIIGHHPHVPQGWEEFNGKPIFYSLGNFFFEMSSDNKYWNNGYVVSFLIDEKKIKYKIYPVKSSNGYVQIDGSEAILNYLHNLCELIQSDNYIEMMNQYAEKLWRIRYKKYYMNSMNAYDSLYGLVKSFIKYLINSNRKEKELLLLLHNIRIESHRWVVIRAISNLVELNIINN